MKIAILYICTGKYGIFWRDFYLSCEKHFIRDAEKDYFVFTDAEHIDFEENSSIHKIFQKNLGWPDNTLRRYEFFYSQIESLKESDYIFFFNANLLFIEDINEEDFLPSGSCDLVGCMHPGFYGKDKSLFPYEKNVKSTAYVEDKKAVYYYQGAINGGKSGAFIEAIKKIRNNVEIDYGNSVIAIWHDESHWNRYLNERQDITKTLTPSYLYPENYNTPFAPKIFIRNKDQFGNIGIIRNIRTKFSISLFFDLYKRIKNKIIYTLFRFFDFVFYSKARLFNLKKNITNSDRKMSVVITYYNRHETIHKTLFNIVNDDRVGEILIVDDGSEDKSFQYLSKLIDKVNAVYGNKIKVLKNDFNLGMYKNKIHSLGQPSNEWAILLDSDNTITKEYLDSIYSLKEWDRDTMYCPSFAWPLINNEKLSNSRYNFDSIRKLLIHDSAKIKSFLNLGNFFVHKDSLVNIMTKYLDCVPFAADSIFINYAWLCNDKKLFIPRNCRYVHRVNPDSTWKIENMKSVIKFENIKNAILISEKDPKKSL